jgi:hypothetical protein
MKLIRGNEPISEGTARNCFFVNQFATPGLGSMMGGHLIAGIGQLLLALIGFALVMAWFVLTLKESYNFDINGTGTPRSYAIFGIAGLIIFGAGWIWALVTSLGLMREARQNRATPKLPPPLPKAPPTNL